MAPPSTHPWLWNTFAEKSGLHPLQLNAMRYIPFRITKKKKSWKYWQKLQLFSGTNLDAGAPPPPSTWFEKLTNERKLFNLSDLTSCLISWPLKDLVVSRVTTESRDNNSLPWLGCNGNTNKQWSCEFRVEGWSLWCVELTPKMKGPPLTWTQQTAIVKATNL